MLVEAASVLARALLPSMPVQTLLPILGKSVRTVKHVVVVVVVVLVVVVVVIVVVVAAAAVVVASSS